MLQDSHLLLLIHQFPDWWVLSAAPFRSMWAEYTTHPPTLKVSGSNTHGANTKSFFPVAKEDFKCFISIKYLHLCQISWKKEMRVGAQNETTRTWPMYLLHTRLHLYHYTTPTYTDPEIFKLQNLVYVLNKVKKYQKDNSMYLLNQWQASFYVFLLWFWILKLLLLL